MRTHRNSNTEILEQKKPTFWSKRNTETKTVSQTVKRGEIQNSNHLHNVKHVVQSTFLTYVNNF